jgi:hypothetical protein
MKTNGVKVIGVCQFWCTDLVLGINPISFSHDSVRIYREQRGETCNHIWLGNVPDRFLSFTIPQSEMRCPDETLRREEAYRYHKAPVYAFGFVCSGTMAVWKIGMDRQYMVIN